MRYYLVTDIGTQWFTKIVAQDAEDNISSQIDVPSGIGGDFLRNIYSREETSKSIRVEGMTFGGWNVSKVEFDRIQRLVELWPAVQEFNKLQGYNV